MLKWETKKKKKNKKKPNGIKWFNKIFNELCFRPRFVVAAAAAAIDNYKTLKPVISMIFGSLELSEGQLVLIKRIDSIGRRDAAKVVN